VIREIIAVVLGVIGLVLAAICAYILAGWATLGLLVGLTLVTIAVTLGLRPDKPV
jgi:hypothetical protein